MVDWTKPIRHANGDPVNLVRTRPEGWTQWGARSDGAYPTRMIHRLGIDESTLGGVMTAYWFVHEDGKTGQDGYDIVNCHTPASA